MDYDLCSTETTDSKVVVQENRSRFEVNNRRRESLKKVQVDGCLINDHREKCDWIIEVNNLNKRALFIELKGCDVDKAISQLKSTLVHTRNKYKDYSKECFAVTTRIPKHGASTRKKCIDFHKETKATLSIKNLNTSIVA
ncbi:hypothetical protein LOC50_03700 [Pseudoalteromonas sp. SCSIO 43095]|uniref:hypothetical protein n=1 Tax=unclassified Pseudoalteromonas TaxID=194690 RepID=UPI00202BA139|nr:hypothetical protein [Pseudoalteromonas sp. SCSIO 43095]URQ99428.1 hypothetical protein LOC50_03700 [Pseudoalteromonas sp. SCSIO 43095]